MDPVRNLQRKAAVSFGTDMAELSKEFITSERSGPAMKEAIKDLVRVKEELDAIVESLELTRDARFMRSYSQARKEIRERDFADWHGL